jgi:hypothetical protein
VAAAPGYRKLVVNEAEAETVRTIFRRCLDLDSVRELKAALDAEGIVSKRRTAADGSAYGGNSFSRGALHQMLQNRVYRGEIVHKGAAYSGEHPPIVDEDLWRRVQGRLEANGVDRRTEREESQQACLLAGVLFDANGAPMTPTHAIKKGLRYRYYVSRRLIIGVRAERERDHETGQRLPAVELERLVVERLRTFFADPEAIVEALPPRRRNAPSVKRALGAAVGVVRTIDAGGDATRLDVLRPLIARAQVHSDRIDIELRADAVAQTLLPGSNTIHDAPGDPPGDTPTNSFSESDVAGLGGHIRLTIAAAPKRAGMEMKFVIHGADEKATPDSGLVRLLIRAHSLARRLATSPGSSLEDVGAQEGMGAPYAARLMRLNFLAPEIVVAILRGHQPIGLTARKLMADTRLPLEWSGQRATLGFD